MSRMQRATVGGYFALACDVFQWNRGCIVEGYYIYQENQLKSTSKTLTLTPLKLSDVGFYVCTTTVNGYNFTSNPAFISPSVQCKY